MSFIYHAFIGTVAGLILLIGVIVRADEYDDFAEELNQAWNQTNTAQMGNLINNRLNADTNDVMALSTKMYYYAFADCNLTNARQAADQLYAVIQLEDDDDANAFFLEMKNEVYGVSLSESGPFSQSEIEQLHEGLHSFPFIRNCLWLSKKLASN